MQNRSVIKIQNRNRTSVCRWFCFSAWETFLPFSLFLPRATNGPRATCWTPQVYRLRFFQTSKTEPEPDQNLPDGEVVGAGGQNGPTERGELWREPEAGLAEPAEPAGIFWFWSRTTRTDPLTRANYSLEIIRIKWKNK